jgi:hypothetical protein
MRKFVMRVKLKVIVFLVATVLLAGCRVDFSSELYARDILSGENLTFPALLEIEIPSCNSDDRPKYEREILSVFSEFSEASVVGCRNDSLTSLLQVKFNGELSSSESSADMVMFRGENDAGNTYLMPDLNKNFLSRVNRVLEDNFQELEYQNVNIAFELHNDLDSAIKYSMLSGWVNGKPGQYISGELQRREKINVRTPDIIADLTLNNKQPIAIFVDEMD